MSHLARLATLGSMLLACGSSAPVPDSPNAEATSVVEVRVLREDLVQPILCTGTIAAHKTTDIGPRVDGIIEEVFVKVGDRVSANQPLFRTRDVEYRIRVREAEYSLRLARAEAEMVASDRARIEKLHESGVASDAQLQNTRARDEMTASRRGAAQAALASVRQELEDTLVRAPYDGTITRRSVDEGMMLRTMLSGGAAVVQIMKTDIVAAIVTAPEVHLSELRIGTRARIRIDGLGDVFESEVYIINDRIDPAARSIELRLPLDNPDYAIKPGLFVQAELYPDPRPALTLDRRAVHGTGRDRYAFVRRDGRAEPVAIQVRDLDDRRVEVLSGLAEDHAALVALPPGRLAQGSAVRIEAQDASL
jgi:RND family efflux transporter MFP subunit